MQFDSSYITTAGSELFARATASASSNVSHPIVWGSVYTSKTDMRSLTQEEMKALTSIPENERSSSGSVTSARHDVIDGNHIVKLECEINNRQYHGSAYAIGIYAKLNSDSNEVLAAIARVDTNGSTPDIIQQSGEYLAIIDFAIAIRGDQFNIQKVDSSYYASAKSMQDLANRVVTTHVESDVTVGEDQEVYGSKYFQNGIMLNGQDGRPCIQLTDVYGRDDVAYEVSIHTIDRGLSLVAGNHLFNDTDRIFMMELDNGTALFDTTRQRASFYVPELYVDSVNTNSLVTETDSIILKSNITPNDATVTIGTQDHPFEDIYSTIVNATDVYCNYISVSGDISAVDVSMHTAACYSEITPTIIRTVKVDHDRIQGINRDISKSTVKYSTMWLDSNKASIVFTCGGGETHINDTTMKVFELNTYSVRAYQPLYMENGAQLAEGKTLTLKGKVVCEPSVTNQVMLAVPDSDKAVAIETEARSFTADVPVGSIIMLYDKISKFTRGAGGTASSLGLEAGRHFDVDSYNKITLAMGVGSASETQVPNWTWCGNSSNFSNATNKQKVYLPYGEYVALNAATATSLDHWVIVLAMRIS